MTFRFLDISENDEQEFKTQLRIAYNSHFKNTKPFDDVFTDWNIPELSISGRKSKIIANKLQERPAQKVHLAQIQKLLI